MNKILTALDNPDFHKRQRKALLPSRKQSFFVGVPGMARFSRVKVPPRVATAKCSEPQAVIGNDNGGGSGVAKPTSLRTETGYKAKRWVRLQHKPKPKR